MQNFVASRLGLIIWCYRISGITFWAALVFSLTEGYPLMDLHKKYFFNKWKKYYFYNKMKNLISYNSNEQNKKLHWQTLYQFCLYQFFKLFKFQFANNWNPQGLIIYMYVYSSKATTTLFTLKYLLIYLLVHTERVDLIEIYLLRLGESSSE